MQSATFCHEIAVIFYGGLRCHT